MNANTSIEEGIKTKAWRPAIAGEEEADEKQKCERDESEYPWIMFSIDGTAYAVNSKYVLSIEILEEITPIVDAPYYCPGITESRGDYIELVDTRALFGLGDYLSARIDKTNTRHMMVVTEIDETKRGLIVDDIISVEFIAKFTQDVLGDADAKMKSQYVRQIAIRDKTETPVLIINHDSFSIL